MVRKGMALGAALTILALSSPATAQQSVAEAVDRYEAALNSCDLEAFGALHHQGFKGFIVRGSSGAGFGVPALRQMCDGGFLFDLDMSCVTSLETPEVTAQLCTARGTLARPGAAPQPNNLRISLVWQSTDNGWQVRQSHYSPLR